MHAICIDQKDLIKQRARNMKVKSKLPLTVFLIPCLLLYALASVSLASDEVNRDPERDVRQCEQRCQRQQPYFEEHHCRQRCEAEQRERRSGRWDDYNKEGSAAGGRFGEGGAEEVYERCQERCKGTGKGQWQCQRTCQDQYEAALERERQQHHHHPPPGGRGERYPREHDYRHCLQKCEDREEGFPRQRQCKLQCEEEFGHRERHGHRKGERERRGGRNDIHNSKTTKKEKEESDNPYYFSLKSFESQYSTQEGEMRVLQRFSEKSDLLLGIDRFRVGFYEANPNTFMLPHHGDVDSVLFVIKGKASMTFVRQENRETYDLERGDILMIPSGTTTYLVNSDEKEKLQIAMLLHPVNTPGHYQQFFGAGGGELESFLNSFSTEILQAALNVPREQLERLFKQQKEGAIVKVRREQVKALAQHRMSRRELGGESRGPLNVFDQRPRFSNEHGDFFEVSPNEYELLEELDVSVAYCNIKQGSMMAPHYNSRTTFIVMVEEGNGYIEMASPRNESQSNNKKGEKKEQRGSSPSYKRVRSSLSKGDVFVVPAGHPVTLVASENENLKAVGFGINAQSNMMNFLAGQENIISLLDNVAKELSFKMPAREVEEMFQKQRKSYFMAGPQTKDNALLPSILDFAGF